jgi:hypothetical protein
LTNLPISKLLISQESTLKGHTALDALPLQLADVVKDVELKSVTGVTRFSLGLLIESVSTLASATGTVSASLVLREKKNSSLGCFLGLGSIVTTSTNSAKQAV